MEPRMAGGSPLRDVFDLTRPEANVLFGTTLEEARARVASGETEAVRSIEGHFALVGRQGHLVRLARSLQVPMRYFVAKQADGPALVVAHRIDEIGDWLAAHGLADQFHPSYTRMVPAHHVTEIALVGCPDPSPTYRRYLAPRRDALPADLDEIGARYVGALADEIGRWLRSLPEREPIGVSFSGGIDSGAVFLVLLRQLRALGLSPARLKAFTLVVRGEDASDAAVSGEGDDTDLAQARRFLRALGLELYHEPIEVSLADVDLAESVRVIEDYKPLDIQAGAMALALCRGIRERYPDWTYLVDGDGGDENLKDYPIEENPELTIRSVLGNPLLYHEGWGVDSIKHSLTYSGGLSRGCTRGFAPAAAFGLRTFSPFTLPNVVEVAEGIPFIELTQWSHERLYALKGEVVARGVRAVTGLDMPVHRKRRFQHGVGERAALSRRLPEERAVYRRLFESLHHAARHDAGTHGAV